MRITVLLFVSVLLAACKPEGPVPLLQGDHPNPVTGTVGLANDLFIVVMDVPFGHQDLLTLVVAEDGSHERATFVAPSALKLKKGDVIKASRLCYRADERPGADGHRVLSDSCTDVVTPYTTPTAEAPPPPPSPDVTPAPEAPQPQAPPNPQ